MSAPGAEAALPLRALAGAGAPAPTAAAAVPAPPVAAVPRPAAAATAPAQPLAPRPEPTAPAWSLAALRGRLCELSAPAGAGLTTAAVGLVLEAQLEREPAAWIGVGPDTFFAPDVAEHGVDLAALPVIATPDAQTAARAADKLLRSGGFGLVVLDLGPAPIVPTPLLARLLQLARHHDAALVALSHKAPRQPSLGSLVSLRAAVGLERLAPGRFAVTIDVLKDKRRGPGARHREVYRGPDGLH